MTQEIKQRLQAELDELETELRIHLPKEIKRALEFGDLRENAEYRAALDRQEMVKARITQLRQRLSEVASIDISKVPEESDPQGGLISTTSPVGRSLMGKEEGDEVTVSTPAGARNFEIRRLATLHDKIDENSDKRSQ